jgi:hypothetical protein
MPGDARSGPYRVLGVLGRGGTGQVLRAHAGGHERDLALACSLDADGDAQLRWTWSDTGTLAVVEVRGGGEDALSDLVSRWDDEADRR